MSGHRKKGQNLTKMPRTFDIVAQINIKVHLWIALIKTFRMNIIFWFRGGPNFAIVFDNDVIMTSFVIVQLSNLHILQNII